jgi:hypothetical protein
MPPLAAVDSPAALPVPVAVSPAATGTVPVPDWLGTLTEHLPSWMAPLFLVMGALRFFLKPLTSLVHSYLESTGDTAFHRKWDAAMESAWFRWIGYVLDFTASVKIVKRTLPPEA